MKIADYCPLIKCIFHSLLYKIIVVKTNNLLITRIKDIFEFPFPAEFTVQQQRHPVAGFPGTRQVVGDDDDGFITFYNMLFVLLFHLYKYRIQFAI
jgi:hypothetical protein